MRGWMRANALAVVLWCLGVHVQAQGGEPFLDRVSLHSGFGVYWSRLTFPNGASALSQNPIYFNLVLNGSYLLAHSNDVYSLSADVMVNVSPFIIFTSGPTDFFFQPGAFLMGRAWAGSTRYNQQRLGVGAGVGYTYTYQQLPLVIGTNRDYLLTQWYPSPAVVLELTWNTRNGSGYTLRGQYNLVPYDDTDRVLGPLRYENFGVGLLVRMR